MDNITIGLFREKETGEYVSSVTGLNNTFQCYDASRFEKITEFKHTVYSEKEIRKDLERA